jgi:hypothetical protein
MDPLLSAAHAMREWFVAVRVNAGPWVGPPPIRQLKRAVAIAPSYSFRRLTRVDAHGESAYRILDVLIDVMHQTPRFNKTNEAKRAMRACDHAVQRIYACATRERLPDYFAMEALVRAGIWWYYRRPDIDMNRPNAHAYDQAWSDMLAQHLIDQLEFRRWDIRHRAFVDANALRIELSDLALAVRQAHDQGANLRFVSLGSRRTALETLRLLIEEAPRDMRPPLRAAETLLDAYTPLLPDHQLAVMQGARPSSTSPFQTLPEEMLRALLQRDNHI